MNNYITTFLLIGGLGGLTRTAQAQLAFSIGPKAGINVATTWFAPDERYPGVVITSNTSSRTGLEVGVGSSLSLGHWLVQPAVLYSQKGFQVQGTRSNVIGTDGTQPAPYQQTNRMTYLMFPLNIVYAQHQQGEGIQLFAGPYLGFLVAGNYQLTLPSTTLVVEVTGDIAGGERPTNYNGFTNHTLYSQRVDAGFQAGLGYQWHQVLLQTAYSVGLRNLAPTDFASHSYLGNGPNYSNRVWQLSLAYLIALKSR